MGTNNVIFLEVIEWFDETGKELVHRIPETGSGEIKFGAQLTVRESQVAVFFYNGKAHDAFGAGRHTLSTRNIPILTKVLSLPWGMHSPLRAEVYFVNMKTFPNLKWGTRDPVAFRDSQLGLIRLRAFGIFNFKVIEPVVFINSLVGTQGIYTMAEVEEYLNRVVVARFNDFMGENLKSVFDLPSQYDEFSTDLRKRLQEDFSQHGLRLTQLYINSITPPPEVQKAIDDKSSLAIFTDLNSLMKMKAAMALEKAAENKSEAGAALGMGLGVMMPSMYADMTRKPEAGPPRTAECPGCHEPLPDGAKFCSKCGHRIPIPGRCTECGQEMPARARFCSHCGHAAGQQGVSVKCPHCGVENSSDATYCKQCGEKLK